MRREDFEAMYAIEGTFWWYRGMRLIVDAVSGAKSFGKDTRILDAGCGTGFNLSHFVCSGSRAVYGLDIAQDAIEFNRRRGITTVCQASMTEIPFSASTFDFVFALDSISHVPLGLQPEALKEFFRILRPKGTLIMRVPAYEWMRSSHDHGMGNTRRYTVPELRAKLQAAGFALHWASYANCFLFPALLIIRTLKKLGIGGGSDVRPLPPSLGWMSFLLQKTLSSEAAVLGRGGHLPFGLSVICRAQKPG